MKQERNYAFRERMLQVHEKNLRDDNLLPLSDELELKDGLVISFAPDADEVVLTAAKDLPENVIGGVADCGYTSAKEIIKKVKKELEEKEKELIELENNINKSYN